MRITILWSSLASYTVAFFRELATTQGCRLQLIYQGAKSEAPYNRFDLSFCDEAMKDSPDIKSQLKSLVNEFEPDCVLMSSWAFQHFMRLSKSLRRAGVFVISSMDNQWDGTLKQRLGVLSSRWFLKPSIDTFLVAGDRQADFAKKLGYDDVLYGFCAGEVERFSTDKPVTSRPKAFLYLGRLVRVKGVEQLIRAYRGYREQSKDPWGLKIAGNGELCYMVKGIPGVEYLGFVQPGELPRVVQQARCFILPSIWEPWGVVIHEAAAAGLPIIATYRCGAVSSFLRDGVNGFIVPPRSERIMDAMLKVVNSSDAELKSMSQVSLALAKLWSPSMLAKYFVFSVAARMEDSKCKTMFVKR